MFGTRQGTRQRGTLSGQATGRASLSTDPPGGRPECPQGEYLKAVGVTHIHAYIYPLIPIYHLGAIVGPSYILTYITLLINTYLHISVGADVVIGSNLLR